jgi:protein subunit release factor A
MTSSQVTIQQALEMDKCGGYSFNIYSKENQDFAKELEEEYNEKADKLKAQITEIQKFKRKLQKLPAKEFNNNLKSKKHMSDSQKKKEMIDRQNKKIAAKKQAIKDHEEEVYGKFRPAN